ncbi:MAG: transposase [Thermodesulfobacteriota bacterium]|nr:transposase [Thermodesulfobacteriota bacterium]
MPRKSRIDAPGALHHIIARGIDRCEIFRDNADRNNFLDRLGGIVSETTTSCYAWALIPNHFHLLLRTGAVPVATVMRRLLTGYAVSHNRRHRRSGHVFQNRYKSILCQEDAYLLELVRYIHLNPLRAGMVKHMKALDRYRFCGHSALMGKVVRQWQDTDWVLKLYDDRLWMGRRRYRAFVEKGISQGRRSDLIGGGLIRSSGGWAEVKAKRKAKVFEKSDERILGDGDFVEEVLAAAQEQTERRYSLAAKGYDLDTIASRVCDMMKIDASSLWAPGKERKRVEARSVLCYWAVRDLGTSMAELSRRLKLSVSGVSLSVKRGEGIVQDRGYRLIGR